MTGAWYLEFLTYGWTNASGGAQPVVYWTTSARRGGQEITQLPPIGPTAGSHESVKSNATRRGRGGGVRTREEEEEEEMVVVVVGQVGWDGKRWGEEELGRSSRERMEMPATNGALACLHAHRLHGHAHAPPPGQANLLHGFAGRPLDRCLCAPFLRPSMAMERLTSDQRRNTCLTWGFIVSPCFWARRPLLARPRTA